MRVQAGDLEVSSLVVQAASLRMEVHTGALVLSVAADLGQLPSTSVLGDLPKRSPLLSRCLRLPPWRG